MAFGHIILILHWISLVTPIESVAGMPPKNKQLAPGKGKRLMTRKCKGRTESSKKSPSPDESPLAGCSWWTREKVPKGSKKRENKRLSKTQRAGSTSGVEPLSLSPSPSPQRHLPEIRKKPRYLSREPSAQPRDYIPPNHPLSPPPRRTPSRRGRSPTRRRHSTKRRVTRSRSSRSGSGEGRREHRSSRRHSKNRRHRTPDHYYGFINHVWILGLIFWKIKYPISTWPLKLKLLAKLNNNVRRLNGLIKQ